MGIGPGGLVSDLEMFDVGQAELRPQMVIESIETIQKLWAQDPPYEIDGRFWKIRLAEQCLAPVQGGLRPAPLQQPHPPIAISLLTPNSNSAKTAGERGWIPVSGQFFHRRYLRGHWEKYVEGCEAVGRRPDPDVWRVSRSVLVTETESEAEDYLADPDNGLSFYYTFFHFSFSPGPQGAVHAEARPRAARRGRDDGHGEAHADHRRHARARARPARGAPRGDRATSARS